VGDTGEISVDSNIVTEITDAGKLAKLEEENNLLKEGLDEILRLVPKKLPLFMGINKLLDNKLRQVMSDS